jgi:amidase
MDHCSYGEAIKTETIEELPSKKRDSELPTRRRFLQCSFVSGLTASTIGLACPFAFALRQPSSVPPISVPSFELDEISITELQDGMKSGKYSSQSITERYLKRIEEIDKQGPSLNSVIEINPDVLAVAGALDRERREKGARGPLHGIPMLIKDNIDTADRMMTTAGSLALVGSKPPKNAFVAQRLIDAGVVLIGKSNPSEWANFRSFHSTSGWSGRGGLTRNPYALDRNPCGSSSGSGVAVSSNSCPAAIGTETDGSIVCPASANGLVGIKPTLGLASRSGIIPISHSQDTPGPMCRTVRDAAIVLGVLTGVDPDDDATSGSQGKTFSDYTQFLKRDGLRDARIGVVRKLFGFNDSVDGLMAVALDVLKKEGAILIDPAAIETLEKFGETEVTVLLYELKADLNAYLSRLGPSTPVKSLREIIDFNEHHRDKEMPYFGQDIFLKSEEKGPLTTKEYLDALENNHKMARTDGIDVVMDKYKLDALVAPTGGPAWLTDLVNGDHVSGGSASPAAVAGYPNITVPAGFVHGLPVGLSFFGRAWTEPVLLRIAYAFEQATKFRQPPKYQDHCLL